MVYGSGKYYNIVGSLSRLCQTNGSKSFDNENEYHIRIVVETSTAKAVKISGIINASKADKLLIEATPQIKNEAWNDQSETYCVIWGNRIAIPEELRARILTLGYEGHPGEIVIKRRLRANGAVNAS